MDERLKNAVIACLSVAHMCSIHSIRRYCMECEADAKVEDINAALVDLIADGTVSATQTYFYLPAETIPQ